MSYVDVGKEYETRYLKQIRDDPENGCIFPCFSESCYNDILQERVNKRVEEAYSTEDINIVTLMSIFGQYLYDQYHVSPEDIEFMCTAAFIGHNNAVEAAAAALTKYLFQTGDFLKGESAGKQKGVSQNKTINIDFSKNQESEK